MKPSSVVQALFLFAPCVLAQAQSRPAAPPAPSTPTSTVVIQGGLAVSTRYMGSDERVLVPLVGIEYLHASGFFASTQRGIGFAGSVGRFSYSAGLGYRGEREDKAASRWALGGGSKYLHGMGKVKGSATIQSTLGYELTERLTVQAAAEQPITTRANGALYSVGAALTLLEDGRDTLTLSTSANAGDRKYLRTYHGVSAAQSARSGYAAFAPKAGWHMAEAGVSWQHKLSSEWSVTGMVGAQRLLGDARKSPLTRRTTAPVGAVFATYSY